MPLLPRSRRGTWLLAGAVWLAACAGLWWVQPSVPRAEWEIPKSLQLLGFGADGREIISYRCDPLDSDYCGPIECRDYETGHLLDTIAVEQERGIRPVLAPNGRWLVIGFGSESHWQHQIFDVKHRKAVVRLDVQADSKSRFWSLPIQFSPDGRTLIYGSGHDRTACLRIWNLESNCEAGVINCVRLFPHQPVAVSANGRYLATCDAEKGNAQTNIRIWSLPDLDQCSSVRDVDSCDYVRAISSDGRFVVVGNRRMPDRTHSMRWLDLQTGRRSSLNVALGGDCHFIAADELLVLANSNVGELEYQWWNFADSPKDAILRHSQMTAYVGPQVSPDGKTLIAFLPQAEDHIWHLYNYLGLETLRSKRIEYLQSTAQLLDVRTGRALGRISLGSEMVAWSPDGKMVATVAHMNGRVRLWDIPPRKSQTWFAAGAALLALPIALLTRRRVRKLGAA